MKRLIAALAVCATTSVWAVTAGSDAVMERLKSPANVCVMGDACAENLGAAPVVASARTGDQVYNGACAACHNSGAAGAPKLGDAGNWAGRVDKGMETLVSHVVNGYNAMPARGLCGDCSDEELAAAVSYMLDAL